MSHLSLDSIDSCLICQEITLMRHISVSFRCIVKVYPFETINGQRKKRLKDEKLEREYTKVWSDFSLEVVDKTLVNMFEDFLE